MEIKTSVIQNSEYTRIFADDKREFIINYFKQRKA